MLLQRLLQARQAQFHFASPQDKVRDQVTLALTQRMAGDTVGAKAITQQAYNTIDQLYRDQPDNVVPLAWLSQTYAAMGDKDSALKAAERAIMLYPRAKDHVSGPAFEENLALIQVMFGENSRAITTLTQLSQMAYHSWVYGSAQVTSAFLRLGPIWDPLRADPAFQRLCEEKQP